VEIYGPNHYLNFISENLKKIEKTDELNGRSIFKEKMLENYEIPFESFGYKEFEDIGAVEAKLLKLIKE
jgi:hypothetical protein